MRLGCLACLALVLAATAAARADEGEDAAHSSTYRVVADRAELEPSILGGATLRVFVSAYSLTGAFVPVEPDGFIVSAGSTKLADPFIGYYGASQGDLALAIVVQTTSQYEPALPQIVDGLETQLLTTLRGIGERGRFAVIGYGESVTPGKLVDVKAATNAVKGLSSDNSASEPVLLDAVEHAMKLLKKAKTEPEGRPLRKIVLVIGDGRDLSADRERVTRLGERAAKEGVRIHTIGYAPDDIRRPLLALGELSKRSGGTFRWVRLATGWTTNFGQVRDQIMKQYVLTYLVGAGELDNKKVTVALTGRVTAESPLEVKVPAQNCNGSECATGYCGTGGCMQVRTPEGRGILGWILLIGGIALGGLVVLVIIAYLMSLKGRPTQPKPSQGWPVPGSVPPIKGSVPPVVPVAGSVPPAPIVAAPVAATGPRMFVMAGPSAGQVIGLTHGFTVGKAPDNTFVLDDGYTSSHHVQFAVSGDQITIYDRNSTNGTYINGTRITEYVLTHGMTVKIGSTEFCFLAQ